MASKNTVRIHICSELPSYTYIQYSPTDTQIYKREPFTNCSQALIMFDGYGDNKLIYCPYCGVKLEV